MSAPAAADALLGPAQDTPQPAFGRRHLHAVAGCYFVASFAALGLPPYLTEILPELGDRTAHWAGVLYVVPTVFSALGAPLWGRLADRFGRKRLLLRAQLGLALSFLLAGWADSLAAFTAALALQGVLGGTFAASNGYLGAALEGPALSKALTLMQGSARAALVFAPIVVGSLAPWLSPHRQYALLAVLPLAAAAMLCALPEPGRPRPAPPRTPEQRVFEQASGVDHVQDGESAAPGRRPGPGAASGAPAPLAEAASGHELSASTAIAAGGPTASEAAARGGAPDVRLPTLYALEFVFVFSTVISFPYLIALIEDRIPGISPAASGVLFALPHLCYLVTAMAVHAAFRNRPRLGITLGFTCIALGLAGHGVAGSLPALIAVRLALGAGLTLGLVCLSILAADCAKGRAPGGMFGSLEFFSKAGAAAAGAAAAAGNSWSGPTAPVLTGTAAALVTVLAITAPALVTPALRTRWSR
ncbi:MULTISPECIES: MFS transporter [unclassified Streptomyces]|uniref:MFS transporter n=1 Tax=unclassified Streptomyces TaxID=2593676 RepID=UPI001F038F82|nr:MULTISPECIES: MFS transporter [unclassified Streptomyces]MCH0564937.1 MFS transporter [Streptomyces sp. MUM 2J]MCH0569938.1 MFS transporter [Streptomyces sp. MUM 136J]